MFSSDEGEQKKSIPTRAVPSKSVGGKPLQDTASQIDESSVRQSGGRLLDVPLYPLDKGERAPQQVAWASPLDLLDYLGLGADTLERIYIELKMPPGEEKEFARFVTTLYFAIDAVMAVLPGAGGGRLAVRASHEAGVAAWHALPASAKAQVIGEVAKQMGWPATRASQAINVFFSANTGAGSSTGSSTDGQQQQSGIGNIRDLHGVVA
jgi:hypothetical protein